jgi:prepilin peptidase CpaA
MQEFLPIAGWLAVAVYAAALLYGAVSDLLTFEIPNWVPIAALVVFFPLAWTTGSSLAAIGMHIGAGAVVLGVGFLAYLRGLAGAGDIKLMTAAAIWSGWSALLEYLLLIALAGGLLALLVLVYRRVPLVSRLAAIGWLARLHDKDRGIPYGVAISLAALYLLPYLPLVEALRAR